MPLDPALERFLAKMPPRPPGPVAYPLLRKQAEATIPKIVGSGGLDEVAAVEECEIDGPAGVVRIRVYRPLAPANGVMHYVHGGGWSAGSLLTIDHTARRICRTLAMVVVTSTYRLAPEHPFPAAFEDSLAAAHWFLAEAPKFAHGPLVIGGDSAGGNLVAAICLTLRDQLTRGDRSYDAQLLLYPAVDLRAKAAEYPSRRRNAHPGFRGEDVEVLIASYCGGHDRADPRISPLAAADLSGLPPALIVVLSIDPLRDEAVVYADRLKESGVSVALIEFDHLAHGFVDLAGLIPAAAEASATVLAQFRAMIGSESHG